MFAEMIAIVKICKLSHHFFECYAIGFGKQFYIRLHLRKQFCLAYAADSRVTIDAATPQWRQWLPPYAIGCRVHARLLSHTEAGQAGCRPPEGAALPRRQMLCPCLTPEK